MTRPTAGVLLTLVATAFVSTGCFKLARESPPVERYVLGGAEVGTNSTVARDSTALSIGLRRLDLAPYLSTLAIIVRRADNEIVTTGFHRWAEGPSAGLNRAVSGYLAVAPSIRAVDVAPWPVRSTHDYLVQLHVMRFEGVAPGGTGARSGEAHLLARWEIVRPSDDAMVARGTTDFHAADWTVNDYAGLVTRLDQGLVRLAQDLVACLEQLGPATPIAVRTDSTGSTVGTANTDERVAPRDCSAARE